MRFLSNTYDPRLPDAKNQVSCKIGETHDLAWKRKLEWLAGKVISDPQPTSCHTVAELKAMGMVGIYAL